MEKFSQNSRFQRGSQFKYYVLGYLCISLSLFSLGCGQSKKETYSGMLERKQINLTAEVGGKVKQFPLEEGSMIKKGDFLVALEDDSLQAKVSQAEANLKQVEAKYLEGEAGSRLEEIRLAKANVEQIQANINGLSDNIQHEKNTLKNYETLLMEGAIQEQTVEEQRNKVTTMEANLQSLKDQLTGSQAKSQLVEAGLTKHSLEQLNSSVKEAEANLNLAKIQLGKSKIYADYSGLLEQKIREVGEVVNPGQSLGTIGIVDDMWVKIYIPENKLNQVKIGQVCDLKVDAYPKNTFKGKVVFIGSSAEFTPKNMQTSQDRIYLVYETKVKVLNGFDQLKAGMPMDVSFDGSR
jgi:HlyD family secretion protein